ncbi:hypothetical protein ACVIGB_000553 [Bradyrhizobium sp. USDA 4341]
MVDIAKTDRDLAAGALSPEVGREAYEGVLNRIDNSLGLEEPPHRCYACGGNGKYVQQFIEGRLTGGCDACQGNGFVYEASGKPAPASVTNQIAVASGLNHRMFGLGWGIDWSRPAV